MSNSDLDWLYSDRDRQVPPADPPTRVMPAAGPVTPSEPPSEPARGRRRKRRERDRRERERRESGSRPAAAPPAHTRPAPAPVRRRRRGGFGRGLFTVVLIVLVWLIGVPLFHLARAGSVDATPAGDRPAEQPGTAILLAGNDARPGVEGARTDSMMVLFIPTSGKPALISLPRDSYLQIPGHGRNKLNAAYALGGPKLLVQTVETNTGLRIDGYVEVSMQAFPKAVDAVGGIELCLKQPMKDAASKADFPAGCQTMTGAQALAYSRMRKADPRGDLGRVERQREVIGAIAKQAVSPQTLLPWRYWALSDAGAGVVTKSSETSVLELLTAAAAFRTISAGKGISVTVPISSADAQTAAGSSVLWNTELARQMFGDLAKGDTSRLTTLQR